MGAVEDEDRSTHIGRRTVLGALGVGVVGILTGAKVQQLTSDALLPITVRDRTGLTSLLPLAGRFRIYSVTAELPSRSRDDYRLRVDGLVERPASLSYDDL